MATTLISPTSVVVHPIVLLSTVDHFKRLHRKAGERVVGVLLGEIDKNGKVDITNCYAVPFDEDAKSPNIWFVDHNYHENMFLMFKKVTAREKVVGWYSTGPKIRKNDLEIHEIWRKYSIREPVLVIVDVQPKELGIPTKAYITEEEVSEEGLDKVTSRAFRHIPSEIGALEAEEVGVEHLLRDVKDASISTLATQIHDKLNALKSLQNYLTEMENYLEQVIAGKLPLNHTINAQLQDIFNLMPNLTVDEIIRSFAIKTNDMLLVVYLSSIIRSIIALHDLINNKLSNKDLEKKEEEEEKERERKEKEKEEAKKIIIEKFGQNNNNNNNKKDSNTSDGNTKSTQPGADAMKE